MIRTIRTLLILPVLLGPAAVLAQAAQTGPADAAKPLETQPPSATEAPKAAAVLEPAQKAPPSMASVLTKFDLTLYGYINFDMLYDTTRTHNEGQGVGPIARPNTQAGEHGRWIITARNSRFGFRIGAPEYQHMKVSALLETDFDQMYTGASESTYIPQGLLRLRQAHFKIENPWVDVLLGQTTYLYGWQSSFFPATAAMLSLPGEPFQRTPQLRLTKILKSAPVNVEVAAGVFRAPQRDSDIPDFQGGVRFLINDYKGTHSLGAGGTNAYPAALGISGAYRQFRAAMTDNVNAADPTKAAAAPANYPEKKVDGYAGSLDLLLPIIPSRGGQRGNTMTFVGTYAITKGAGDLLGGITGTTAAGKADAAPPAGKMFISPDAQTIVFDSTGKPKAIDWNGIVLNVDYYLPPSGRVFVSGTYSQARSDNIRKWVQTGNRSSVFFRSQYWDANLFLDATPATRLVLSWQHRQTKYADGVTAKNERYHFSAYYFF